MDPFPVVSIVIPVRNEAATIDAALRSAAEQEYAGSLEIIVADGMSTDGTREVVASRAADDARVRLVDNLAGVTPAALNAAIRAARGEVIVRCDAHAVLPPGYVARAVELLHRTGADNVGGMQVPFGRTALQRAIGLAMSIPMGVGDARFHLGGPPGAVDTVYLGVFRRAALERVGGFDEGLLRNQDAELNHRLRASGGTVYFHPDLRVAYEPRASLGALWRQYFSSGAWKRETFRRHPRAFRLRQGAPPTLVLALLVSATLAIAGPRRLAALVPGAYLGAIVLTSVWTALRRRSLAAFLLPIVLPAMHLGWGLGFLFGRPTARRSPTSPHMIG